ncbi:MULTISPECIES: cupredoxin domain-containing protein [unclassified Fredinandcohnia]|uniref:cupredoxin domain-containing protein n=1 Tax=unclassified Fredinandcohnia TaxID=2837514 RepID=UPI0030FDCE16
MKFVVIKRSWIVAAFVAAVVMIGGWVWLQPEIIPTIAPQTTAKDDVVIHITTGELKSKTDEGKEIESYFWNPGTVYVPQGKEVTFNIYGVNGKEHSFYIEGTDIKGTVKKGEEITINANFEKEGMYRIICLNHSDINNNGPMIGYIVVD